MRNRRIVQAQLAAPALPSSRARSARASSSRAGFFETDRANAPLVVILNRTAAQQLWPGQSAIGKRLTSANPLGPTTVVGIVEDVRLGGPSEPAPPTFYVPFAQLSEEAWSWARSLFLVARADGDPAAIGGPVRRVLSNIDPGIPLFSMMTMEQRMASTVETARFNTMLLGMLGVAGLLLAAVGIYGVIGYFAAERTLEIGIRMALGASRLDVVRLVVGHAAIPVLGGVALGALGALFASRAIASQLVNVRPTDPLTFAGVAGDQEESNRRQEDQEQFRFRLPFITFLGWFAHPCPRRVEETTLAGVSQPGGNCTAFAAHIEVPRKIHGARLASRRDMEWPSSERIESITERVIGCAITVHTALGPGLLESIYQDCPAIELRTQKVSFEHDHRVRVTYRGEGVRDDLKVDLLVERTVIVEVKAVERLHPVHQAQVIHVPEAHRMSGGSADELQLAEPTRWVEATQSSRLVRRSPRRKERIGCTGTREQEVVSASRSGCEI